MARALAPALGGRPVVVAWIKRMWRCRHELCPTRTWTETNPAIAARASMTARARAEICRRVGEDGASVAAVARESGIGWRTPMATVREHGQPRVDDPGRVAGIDAFGVDETAFQAAAATRRRGPTRSPSWWSTGACPMRTPSTPR